MKIIISGRHLKITEPIKDYTEEKIGRLKKYFDNILEVDVTLSVEQSKTEGDLHKADGLLFANGTKIKVEAENNDLYAAIDELSDMLERQVRKYKEKLKDHNKKGTH
ncbi:MAG: ribosome-associated translation inhibitor RaiA [Leptotrichiaceae bacterium]